jgi:hypothetical protein
MTSPCLPNVKALAIGFVFFLVAALVVAQRLRTNQDGRQKVSQALSKVAEETLLKTIFLRLDRRPAADVLLSISPGNAAALVTAFRAEAALRNRTALTWALAYAGGEEAVGVLEHALMEEYSGQFFKWSRRRDSDDEMVLFDMVIALGLLAADSDHAFAIVRNGTNPGYWRDRCKWRSDRGDGTVGMLTALSIQAVGLSGRPEAPDLIDAIKRRMPGTEPGELPLSRGVKGDVVQAAFFADTIKALGVGPFKRAFARGETDDLWKTWNATERGKRYHEWYKGGLGVPTVDDPGTIVN